MENLSQLLVHELRELYSAESQLVATWPELLRAANDDELRTVLEEHLEETRQHVSRLDAVLERLGEAPDGHESAAMRGLLQEASEVWSEVAEPAVKDAALIIAVQKIEHYEIAGYGSARTLAGVLGHDDLAELLQETLDEESATDDRLSDLAESINVDASVGAPDDDDET